MSLRDRITTLREQIDARPPRERVLILVTAAFVLFMLWDFVAREPLAQRIDHADQQIHSVEQQAEAMQQTAAALRSELATLEDDGPERELERARERLAEIDERLTERTLLVISPTEMVTVLRDMLADDRRLTLRTLRNHEVEAVITQGADDEGVPRVYRHRVDVVLTGEYFALLDYMKRLEGLDWQFQWDDLRIETERYPNARATLTISTLSLAEDWIGV